jgi:hypothetical protein
MWRCMVDIHTWVDTRLQCVEGDEDDFNESGVIRWGRIYVGSVYMLCRLIGVAEAGR